MESSSLKRSLSAHSSQLAKLCAEIETAMQSRSNKELVEKLHEKLQSKFQLFVDAHEKYVAHAEVGERDGLEQNRQSTETNYGELCSHIIEWLTNGSQTSTKNSDRISIPGSAESMSSQARYMAAKEKREMAELKAKLLSEQQELERRKVELSQLEEAHKQKRQLEEARLEEQMATRALQESDDVASLKDGSSQNIDASSVTGQVFNNNDMFLQFASKLTSELHLPKPEILTFSGKSTDYSKFVSSFESNVEKRVADDGVRLTYLIQYCTGEAKRAIEVCSLLEPKEGYKRARDILYSRYGQPHVIARSFVDSLVRGPPINAKDTDGLSKLALEMQRCEITLSKLGFSSDVDNSENLRRIVRRLPGYMRTAWVSVAHTVLESGQQPKFSDLAKFVEEKSRLASSVYGLDLVADSGNKKQQSQRVWNKTNKATTLATHGGKAQAKSKYTCRGCGGSCSHLENCDKFKAMPQSERYQLVQKLRLCNNCLRGWHVAKECRKEALCQVPDCNRKHNTLLHRWSLDAQNSVASYAAETGVVKSSYLGIVPVVVHGDNGSCYETYALLDDGSDKTLCSEKLLQKLGVKGRVVSYNIATLNSKETSVHGREVDLVVKAVNDNNRVTLNKVWSVRHLPISTKLIANNHDIKKWPHFSDIALPTTRSCDVMLLIGTDVPDAHVPLEVRSGNKDEPYAVRTRLGWAVRGPASLQKCQRAINVHFQQSSDMLLEQVEKFWKTDFNDGHQPEKSCPSIEDKRALKVMEESIQLSDGHYRMALPWKAPTPNLPSNVSMAQARLQQLKKRLNNDDKLREKYTSTMSEYIDKGYASEIDPTHMSPGKTWYLPHHPVTSKSKPDKVRVVFDGAAKYSGVSLNSQLLPGPDLVNSLVGVLMRFRQEPIAIAADVEAMFHQVKVAKEDCDALRFLWWPGGNTVVTPKHYRMEVFLFGGTASPCAAAYALKRTASDNADKFSSQAVSTVNRDFYVDDLLKSVKSEDEAISLSSELRSMLKLGGFRLTKWVSNSKKVIASVPNTERAKTVVDLSFNDELPSQKALGVEWNVNDDLLSFKTNLESKPATRRGILSTISSIFDPLGIVAPVTLLPKIILQQLCSQNLGWDDPISEACLEKWEKWLQCLPTLENISIPRCYKPPGFGSYKNVQLHIFSDASESGYGACAYLRIVDEDNTVSCSLVMGKSRVTPIKHVSIPRLELTAAVVASRLYSMIISELDIQIDEAVFWTDSMIVINYIRNTNRRFKTFVANRLSTIQELTSPQQWRYISTSENPADIASRGIQAEDNTNLQKWIHGPGFLWKNPIELPTHEVSQHEFEDDDEVKTIAVGVVTQNCVLQRFISRYSGWYKLQRATAWLLRYKAFLINNYSRHTTNVSKGELNVKEIECATQHLLSFVQRSEYPNECSRLDTKKDVRSDSSIVSLNPILKDGLIRSQGRLQNSSLSQGAKHPIILPPRHHVTSLIIDFYHQTNGHTGISQVLASTREKYWIVKGRYAVKKRLDNCFKCKRQHGPLCKQQMGQLLEEQLTPDEPPFTYVGIDFFGPLLVKVKRSVCKRYGCIFSCLTSRAIHLEVAHSLTTDSFIAAFIRFVSRRGKPKKVYSDNGTNMTSGEKEMRTALQAWNEEQVNRYFVQKGIIWHFNPPTASHMGGVFERMIRTTRKVLRAIVNEQLLTDEKLVTVMAETEKIVNDRPLTHVSSDVKDLETLTPNKLLLLRSNSSLPPGTFNKTDQYSERWWRQVQYLSTVFWKRWMREYVPSLQIRTKWQRSNRNMRVGDIVMISDSNSPRGQWPIGRVIAVNIGRDGLVRSCTVKTSSTVLVRPVTKLCLLEGVK